MLKHLAVELDFRASGNHFPSPFPKKIFFILFSRLHGPQHLQNTELGREGRGYQRINASCKWNRLFLDRGRGAVDGVLVVVVEGKLLYNDHFHLIDAEENSTTNNTFFTQFLDAFSFPREMTASTSTEAISDTLYTSHMPKASNVICPEKTASKNVLRKRLRV